MVLGFTGFGGQGNRTNTRTKQKLKSRKAQAEKSRNRKLLFEGLEERRVLTAGILDPTFGTGGIVTTNFTGTADVGRATAIQPDGKIVVAGYTHISGSNDDFAVTRYNPDGSLDGSFGIAGKVTTAITLREDQANSIVIQPDGKILVAGFSTPASNDLDFAVVRYNPDGSLDTTFNGSGIVTTAIGTAADVANGIAIQSDGKIILAGFSHNGKDDFAVVRYKTDGSLDTSFGITGKVTTDFSSRDDQAFGVVVQPDGAIVLVGFTDSSGSDKYDFALARYTSSGVLDTTFDVDGKVVTPIGSADDQASSVALQSDGKIVVAGFSHNGFDGDFALARYNSNGLLDPSFDTDGKLTTSIGGDEHANGVAIQPNGKIIAAGYSSSDFSMARYNSNGSLDTTFGAVATGIVTTSITGGSDAANGIALQSDGGIVLAGVGGVDFAVARYTGDPVGTISATLDGSGNLTVADIFVTGKNNLFTALKDGSGKLVISDANETFVSAPAGWTLAPDARSISILASSFTGTITVNAAAGNDNLAVDASMVATGNPIFFNGDNPTIGPPGDSLSLVGPGTFSNIVHTLSNAADGSVSIDGYLVTYTGLEPVTDNLNAISRSFAFNGGAETITWSVFAGQNKIDSTAGESVTFGNPSASLSIDMGSGDDTLNINSVLAGFAAAVTIVGNAGNDASNLNTSFNLGSATSTGDLSITTESITTSAAGTIVTQTGTGNVQLSANSVSLGATINTSAATSGTVSIAVATSLSMTAAADVTAKGSFAQTGAGTVSTAADVTTSNSALSFASPITLTGDVVFTSGSGNLTLSSTVDGGSNLTANSSGLTTLGGAIGGTTPLTSVTTNVGGTTAINGGSITTTGAQTFNDAVTLGTTTTLTSNSSGNITLGSTVNGAQSLTVNTAGTSTFGGIVGGTSPLTSVTTDASGTTAINGGSITTTGAQTYNDAVTLGAATTLTSNSSGNITLASTVNGAQTLAVNTLGTTTFGGSVGGTAPLTSVTTDAGGTTAINGGSITTTGTQTYNDAVTLGAATTLTTTNSNISFGSTVDNAQTLQLIAGAGDISATGNVGGTTPLTSVTIASANNVTFSGTLNTSGSVSQTTGTGTTTLNGGNISSNLTLNTAAVILNSGTLAVSSTSDLNTSSGGVNQVAGTFTSPSLRLRGSNNFNLSSPTNNFGTLAADVTGNLTVVDTGSLTTGTITGTVGVTSSTGNVSLTTVDSGVAGDNLVVAAGNPISAASGFVLLNAGDDITVNAPIKAGTTVTGNVDVGSVDASGGVFTLSGSVGSPVAITATNGTFLKGNTDNDTFNIYAQTSTAFNVDGDLPVGTVTGDVLAMSVVGTGATLTVGGTAPYNGPGSGTWTFTPSLKDIRFKSIEDSQIIGSYHLTYDFANSVPTTTDLFVMRDSTFAKLQLRDGSNVGPILFQANLATTPSDDGVLSLKVLGTGNSESVTVDDVYTLPVFAAAVPGTPDNTILAGQASLLFEGALGTNKLNFALAGANINQTYAIGNDSGVGSEGEVKTVASAGTLTSYFTGLGATGSVNRTDGSLTPGSLTILGDNLDNTINVSVVGGDTNVNPVNYTPFNYSASSGKHSYNALNLFGLDGKDKLNMQGFGGTVANNPTITLDGGNDNDTLQVGNTNGNSGLISILGQSGNDTVVLSSDALVPSGDNRSDLIYGKVVVDGGPNAGDDQLFLVALANTAALTNVQITSTTIDNVTNYAAGPDVTFNNINLLDVTTTNLADTITTTLTAPSVSNDLAVVNVRGGNANDQFYLHIPATPTNTPAGLTNINLYGNDGDDTFGSSTDKIIPAYSKAAGADIFINGGTPDVPNFDPVTKNSIDGDKAGDRIYLDMSSATAPVIVDTVTGIADSASHRRLVYNGIEDIDLYDNAGQLQNVHQGALYMRATEASDYIVLMGLSGGKVRIRVNNAYYGDYAPVTKLMVHARGGNDYIATSVMPANLPLELYGDEGDDSITGSAAGDLIVGGEGLDRLSGGAGGVDEIWGDVFSPITANANLDIMLNPTDPLALALRASQLNQSIYNSLGGPAAIPSTDGNDIITTAPGNGADRIYGQGGNDIVTASAQNDALYGGDGIDNLNGANGNDRIYGGNGNDNLAGEGGDDFLFGEAGNDTLNGGLGNDVLVGGTGQDILRGDQNRDMVIGGNITNYTSGLVSGNASSTAFGDANDVAMLTLLTNWSAAVAPSIPFSGLTVANDGEIDSLTGGDGADDFYNEAVDLLIDYLVAQGDRKTL